MNNSDLERLLKSAEVPARSDEYWEQFPKRVVAQASRGPALERVEPRWQPRLVWATASVAVCLVIGFAVGHWRGRVEKVSSNGLLQNEKLIRETMAMFPNRVRAIVQDERGLSLLLSENEDVPSSAPLWVKVCDGSRCTAAVTFSGQEVEVAGQKFTVLADSRGGVMLVGDRFIWSSESPPFAKGGLRIEARNLGKSA